MSIFDDDKDSIINHSSIHESMHKTSFHDDIHDHNKIHEEMHFGKGSVNSPLNNSFFDDDDD